MLNAVKSAVLRGFPVFQWLPKYNTEKAISDLVAGITIGLTLIPQCLAYASLAGLSPEYGLYGSLCGGFIYTIFGTTPQLNIAPTALLSLLTHTYTNKASFGAVPAAILLCMFAGIIELICGLLHLGFLVDFVSTPVVVGFTSAGALTIASAQVKNLFGLSFSAENFIGVWTNVVHHIHDIKQWDAILSLCCCILLLGLRQVKDFGSPPISNKNEDKSKHHGCKVFLWFLSVSRNAIVVIGCAVAAFVLEMYDIHPFSLTTKVQSGLPNVSIPQFTITNGNETYRFADMVRELGSGIVVVPFVAILGNVAIAKAFAQGKVVDASQEMVAVGLCNVAGCFFSSMPVNASFARAAVSNASGIKTTMGGIYTGVMVILALTFLTPYFSYIPKATLASVIICAVIFMVEVAVIKPMWKINKIDWIPLWCTFFACLVIGIELGILIGILVDVILLLYYNARPKVAIERICQSGVDYVKVFPNQAILYPSAEYVREIVMKSNLEVGMYPNVIVLDCSKINRADFTTSKCVSALSEDLKKIGKTLMFINVDPKLVRVMTGSSVVPPTIAKSEGELQQIIKATNNPRFSISRLNGKGKDGASEL